MILAVQNPDLITIVDNLLDYEADPFIGDQEGLNAIDHVANAEMRQMLINYVDQTRAKHESNTRSSDNHSFDDFEDEENQISRVRQFLTLSASMKLCGHVLITGSRK